MDIIDKLLTNLKVLKVDDVVEGTVVALDKSAIYVDLGPNGTGIIYGIEYINAREIIKRINVGDVISAKVILRENHDGYVDLSLKEARQAIIWSEAEQAIKDKRTLDLIVKDANKGGILMEWQGMQGFLPASQLKEENYPRVEDGDKDKIMRELKKLIGKRLSVNIISAQPKEGKLIFSQKGLDGATGTSVEMVENIEKAGEYSVGEEVTGTVTGVVEFGIFIKLSNGTEGLVHKSEIDWGLVEDVNNYAKVGQTVKAKIIEIKNGKISLSLKAMKENPWKLAVSKYKKGDVVSGLVIKFNKHGALVSIEEGVAGLCHMSDFGSEEKMKEKLSLGKMGKFEISLFEPADQRMTLVLK
jgi:small subunit ribosomal protein S1